VQNSQSQSHRGQPVYAAGEPLENAQAAMLMLHGRGADAGDILSLASELGRQGFAFLAPQAAGNTWYPNRFMAPLDQNEPWLSSALGIVQELYSHILQAGVPAERVFLLGFSQGACLALEYAARHPRRYGGIAGLSGGLIGPDDLPRPGSGSLEGTPVFLGCSDSDIHIPAYRVDQAEEFMKQLGGDVTKRLYPGMGHTINQDEIAFVRQMMQSQA
jgi:phospholipase/carboxylesterase